MRESVQGDALSTRNAGAASFGAGAEIVARWKAAESDPTAKSLRPLRATCGARGSARQTSFHAWSPQRELPRRLALTFTGALSVSGAIAGSCACSERRAQATQLSRLEPEVGVRTLGRGGAPERLPAPSSTVGQPVTKQP